MTRLLFAAQDPDNPLTKVSQSFKEYSQGQGTMAVVVAGAFLVLILAAILYSLVSARRSSAHWRTFRYFAEASGLTSAETKLFIFIAERVQPDNPVALFVKRSIFENAVQDLGVDAGRAGVLRRKLYSP